jgi:hypothetical protein
MRRRRLLLGTATVALGGCSAREGSGSGAGTDAGSTDPEATPTPADGTLRRGNGTRTSTANPGHVGAVETAGEHLAVAFDELRAMRPVGPEKIRVSADRFRASDHGVVRERIAAAADALDGLGAESGADDVPESVRASRAAVELARSGRELYDAVRRGFRAEWRFERRCYRAEWAEARDHSRRGRRAIDAWVRHGRAVTEAVAAVEAAGPAPVPRLSLDAWRRDGAVLGGVAGPLVDVLGGFRGYAEALRIDASGLDAMDEGEYRTAAERFASAADSVRAAHRRLARAQADGAQGFGSYALPIRRRCEPFRQAFVTQVEAARVAAGGEGDRAETLEARAMDRILNAELEHPLPEPEGGSSRNEPAAESGDGSGQEGDAGAGSVGG